MPKELKSAINVPLRIVLMNPPPGVDFGIPQGKGNDYETISIQRSKTNQHRPQRMAPTAISIGQEVSWPYSFNGKPQATAFH